MIEFVIIQVLSVSALKGAILKDNIDLYTENNFHFGVK